MTNNIHLKMAGLGVCLFAAWNVYLAQAAGGGYFSPYERWSLVALGVWLGSFFLTLMARPGLNAPVFWEWALGVSLFGAMADLNAFKYLGFALAVAGFLRPSFAALLWLGCSASWMPALGWFLKGFSPNAVGMLRISLSLLGAVALIWSIQNQKTNQPVTQV